MGIFNIAIIEHIAFYLHMYCTKIRIILAHCEKKSLDQMPNWPYALSISLFTCIHLKIMFFSFMCAIQTFETKIYYIFIINFKETSYSLHTFVQLFSVGNCPSACVKLSFNANLSKY